MNRLDRKVTRGGQPVILTNKEFTLLEQLVLNCGHCLSRVELLEAVWKLEPTQTTNIVDVYINYLRRKLGDLPPAALIQTMRGKGYMVPIAFPTTATIAKQSRAAILDCPALDDLEPAFA
jgi:DNA-binding response OmpR family regulator